MKLLMLLLRASWKTVLLAGLIGAASGAASIGLVAIDHAHAPRSLCSTALTSACSRPFASSSCSRGSVPRWYSAA